MPKTMNMRKRKDISVQFIFFGQDMFHIFAILCGTFISPIVTDKNRIFQKAIKDRLT